MISCNFTTVVLKVGSFSFYEDYKELYEDYLFEDAQVCKKEPLVSISVHLYKPVIYR